MKVVLRGKFTEQITYIKKIGNISSLQLNSILETSREKMKWNQTKEIEDKKQLHYEIK